MKLRDTFCLPLKRCHDLTAHHFSLGMGFVIVSGHFQSGVSCSVADAFLVHIVLIHPGDSVETEFVGRMIFDPASLAILPNVCIKPIGRYGELGIPFPIQDVDSGQKICL